LNPIANKEQGMSIGEVRFNWRFSIDHWPGNL